MPTTEPDETRPAQRSALPFQKRRQLEQSIEDISAELLRRNTELAETNKTLLLLQTIDAMMLELHASLKQVCEHITEVIEQATSYPFVGLFSLQTHASQQMTLFGWSGSDIVGGSESLGFGRPLHLKLHHPWFSEHERNAQLLQLDGLSDDAIRQFLDCSEAELKGLRAHVPVKTLYVVKLQIRRRLVGVLIIGFTTPITQLSEAEILLLDRLSETIGVALDNKLLFEENQRVLRKLKESNTKLLALDEAKDDFVSMASHQLRTPLTSVKGYLSMVMEGDVGDITPQQKEMLSQAFFSSQRMVYIIADLLNVSRLRTGKFVIEAKPVNLARLVGEEIVQLQEIAKSRQQELVFNPPEHFPELMLDETKTHQIIMNFIDNALHYTQSGGKITVELTENDETVEFRVIDNGMGVPRAEQAHLFTKFYRAGNARKARPDGTGLGLYMAKKVVIAQGGVLIFETKEGEGSAFGFTLNKQKLLIPPITPTD